MTNHTYTTFSWVKIKRKDSVLKFKKRLGSLNLVQVESAENMLTNAKQKKVEGQLSGSVG